MAKLIKFQADWADEFDVYGFKVVTDIEWEQIQEAIQKIEYPREYGFGTNEQILFESSDEFMRALKVVDVTDDEVEVLQKCFPKPWKDGDIEFGWIPVDYVFEDLSDEDFTEITGEQP